MRKETYSERLSNQKELLNPVHDELMILLDRNAEKIITDWWKKKYEPDADKKLNFRGKIWEFPVLSTKKDVIGFIDFHIYLVMEVKYSVQKSGSDKYSEEWFKEHWSFNFEVKPKIHSLGELLRQINLYKTYSSENSRFCVFSPDTRFEETLRAQRVIFFDSKNYT